MALSGFFPKIRISSVIANPQVRAVHYSKPACPNTPSRGGIRSTLNNFLHFPGIHISSNNIDNFLQKQFPE